MMGPSGFRKFMIVGVAVLPSLVIMRDSQYELVQKIELTEGGFALDARTKTRVSLPPWIGEIVVRPNFGVDIVSTRRPGKFPQLTWSEHKAQCHAWGVSIQEIVTDSGTLVASVCSKEGGTTLRRMKQNN